MKINIADGLGIACDEINSVTDCVLLYTSATSRSVMSTVSIHSHDKKARYEVDCYIFHTFTSGHITIHNCYYLLSSCKA